MVINNPAFVVALIALGFACLSLWLSKRAYDTAPRKVIIELLDVLSDMEGRLDRLDGKWKKLNANYASLRSTVNRGRPPANGEDSDDDALDTHMRPGEDALSYKERIRKLIRQGKLSHGA